MRAAPQRRDGAPRGDGAFRDQLAARRRATERSCGRPAGCWRRGRSARLGIPYWTAASAAISQFARWPEKMIIRRPAATARSRWSRPRVSTRPPGSKTRMLRRCGYSAATRPRLSHMPADDALGLGLRSSGKARREIEPGAFGDAETGADAARQRAAERRGAIERQAARSTAKNSAAARPGLQALIGGGPRVACGRRCCVAGLAQVRSALGRSARRSSDTPVEADRHDQRRRSSRQRISTSSTSIPARLRAAARHNPLPS